MKVSPYSGDIRLERGDQVVLERAGKLSGLIARMMPGDVGDAAQAVNDAIAVLTDTLPVAAPAPEVVAAKDEPKADVPADETPAAPKARRTRRRQTG